MSDEENLLGVFNQDLVGRYQYQREAQLAARAYLRDLRFVWWSAPVVVFLVVIEVAVSLPSVVGSIMWLFAIAGVAAIGAKLGQMLGTRRTLDAIRSVAGYGPVPPGVGMTRYVKSLLDGERVPGDLETALLTLWNGDGDLDAAQRVLTKRRVPDVSCGDYQPVIGSRFPVWQRDGLPWQEAPLPDADHACQAWSVALVHAGTEKATVQMPCACGSISYDGAGVWHGRNRRREEISPG